MAVKLGIVNIDRDILQELTAAQLMEWEMYAALEPFDETRDDYRAASICTMLANINRGKNRPAYSYGDFVLKFGEENVKKKQTPEEQLMIARLWASAFDVNGALTRSTEKD